MFKKAINDYCERTGTKADAVKKMIGEVVFPEKTPESKQVTVSNLFRGKKTGMTFDEVKAFCLLMEISPSKFFGEIEIDQSKSQKVVNELVGVLKSNGVI